MFGKSIRHLKDDFRTTSGSQWAWRFILLSFVFPRRWQVWALLIVAIYISIQYFTRPWPVKIHLFKPVLLLASPFLIYLPLYLTVPDHDISLVNEFVERKSALLALPFMLILFSQHQEKPKEQLWIWFVAAVIVRGLFGHILILIKYHTFLISWNHVSYRQAMEWAMQMHPTTFGVYAGMAITFLLEFGFQSPQKKIYWFSYSLLTVMLILLFPKMPVFALFFVHLMFGFRQRKQLKRLRVVIPVLGVVAALCFLLNLHLVKDRIHELLPGSSTVSAPNSVQVRQLIWQTDLALLKHHWLKGMGPGELQRNLDLSMLYQSSLAGQSLGSYNTHNEYLNYWLVFGIPGIVVLVALIIFLAFKAFQSSRLSFQAFVILVSGVFLTENWLSVQHGVVFIAILGTLFLCSPAMLNSGKEH